MAGAGGRAVVEGRGGLRGLTGLFGDALARLRGGRRLRVSLALWTALGLVLIEAFAIGVAALQSAEAARAAAAAAAGWWLLVSLGLVAGIPLLVTPPPERRPVDGLGVPNGLTAIRAWSCLPLLLCAVLSLPGRSGLYIWSCVGGVSGMLDAVDGYLARRIGPVTMLGQALDPAMDALFFAMAAYGNFRLGIIPGWLAGLMLVRYVGPLLGTPVVLLARRRPELVHTRWGRTNTLLTGVVLFCCLITKLIDGPLDQVALGLGIPLLGGTTVLHFVSLARRTHQAPVVRERRRERR